MRWFHALHPVVVQEDQVLPRPLLLHAAACWSAGRVQNRNGGRFHWTGKQASKQAGGLILYMRIEQEHAENDRNLPLPCNAPAAGHGSGARPSRSWITSATDHPAPRRPDSREIEANAPKKISGFAKHSGASPRGVPQGIRRARTRRTLEAAAATTQVALWRGVVEVGRGGAGRVFR